MTSLPPQYQPGPYDVICGCRTQKSFDHIGNRRFRIIIENHSNSYHLANTKLDKSVIVVSILNTIQDAGGSFVRKQEKNWEILPMPQTKEKIGHALRDAIICQQKKSASHRCIKDVINGNRTSKEKNENLSSNPKRKVISFYQKINDLANSTRPSTVLSQRLVDKLPSDIEDISALHKNIDGFSNSSNAIAGSTPSVVSEDDDDSSSDESLKYEPLHVTSQSEEFNHSISALLSSWVEQNNGILSSENVTRQEAQNVGSITTKNITSARGA